MDPNGSFINNFSECGSQESCDSSNKDFFTQKHDSVGKGV